MTATRTALTVALAAALLGCSSNDPAALLASARQYMAKREYKASAIQLKNVLQNSPEHGEARYLLGLALLEQDDPVAAQIELDKAVAAGYSSDDLQVALARAALAKGEGGKVIERFGTKTLSDTKVQAELIALVGTAHLALRQPKEADRAFAEALKLDASNVNAHLGTARSAAAGQDLNEALVRVERALAKAPANRQALLFKGDVLAAQGKLDEAEASYRAAIEAAPGHIAPRLILVTHLIRMRALDRASAEVGKMEQAAAGAPATSYAKAMVLAEQKKWPGAREAALRVLKAAPEHVPSLTVAGMAALETGALPEAESHLRRAVFTAPNAIPAKRLLAATHLRMGQVELAMSEAQELLSITKGEHPGVHALAGEAYLLRGDLSNAARHYERAKALAPSITSLQMRLAQVRFAAGDAQRGFAELESASAGDTDGYQADLALITAYLRQQQADKALEAIQALEKKQPDPALTHNLRGVALLLKRDAAGARTSFEHAVRIRPTYLPAVANLAQLDLRDKKPEAARQRYEALLKAEPNNEQAMLGLASVLRMAGANAPEIEKLLVHAVTTNPGSANARTSLVNFHLRNRDTKAALSAAQDAHAALPANARLLQMLGSTQLAAGETRQAISSFTRLSEMLPKAVGVRLLLARAHLIAKEPDEALKALRAALDLRPEIVVVQRELIGLYIATGKLDEALRHAREAQAQVPQQPHGHVLEAEIRIAEKKLGLAEGKYRESLKQFDLPAIAVRLHAALEALGKRAAAEALAQDWLKRHPNDAIVISYLADMDIASKRYESAASRYQTALKRQPDNAAFLNNLAWVSNELKRPAALEYAERAYELAPDNPGIMDTLGTILAGSGQIERALELLSRASELAPDHHVIRLNFAKALIQADRKAPARKELEALAKLDARIPVQQEAAKLLGGL